MLVRTNGGCEETNELLSAHHVDDDDCTCVSEERDDKGQEFCSDRDFLYHELPIPRASSPQRTLEVDVSEGAVDKRTNSFVGTRSLCVSVYIRFHNYCYTSTL